jgi:hypothetical protein
MVALLLVALMPAARNAVRALLNVQAVPDQQHMAVLPSQTWVTTPPTALSATASPRS